MPKRQRPVLSYFQLPIDAVVAGLVWKTIGVGSLLVFFGVISMFGERRFEGQFLFVSGGNGVGCVGQRVLWLTVLVGAYAAGRRICVCCLKTWLDWWETL